MNLQTQTQMLSSSSWQKINFFKGLPLEILKDLLRDSEIITIGPKKILFHEGDRADHFGFVIDGVFKLHRIDPLGQRVAIDFVSAGEIIAGLLMASEDSAYPVTVQSLTPSKFLKISKTTYNDLWGKSSEVMRRIQIASQERVLSLQTMCEAQRLPLEQRVAWIILRQLARFPESNNFLKVYFSRVDVADAVGAASESVIRVFSKWIKDGIIVTKDGEEFIDLGRLNQNYFPLNRPADFIRQ